MKLLYHSLVSLAAISYQLEGGKSFSHEGPPFLPPTSSKPSLDAYIVLFKPHVAPETVSSHHAWVRELCKLALVDYSDPIRRAQAPLDDKDLHMITHTYNMSGEFLGYSASLAGPIISQIRHCKDVRPNPVG